MHTKISDYFEGVAAKYLSAVDADPEKSHQHEIGGLLKAGFGHLLGKPGKNEVFTFPARQIYIDEQSETPVSCESDVSWYDARANNPNRSAEYRLYYLTTPVIQQIKPGDFFLIAKLRDESLLMIFTPSGSTIENQLRWLFGLGEINEVFSSGALDAHEILLPLRLLLEELGIEFKGSERDESDWLDTLTSLFGGTAFPSTTAFSGFARDSIPIEVDPITDPDHTLISWMEHEEKLFRIYERHLVKVRLQRGFGEHGDDVDEFISFSLSVQNRRKSRVGHAFEGHLSTIFQHNHLRFEQGGKNRYTENESRPDFLFPDFSSYHAPDFDSTKLILLGAKTTCKDRWRQVLSEGNRVTNKHLVTLEASISKAQTDEMRGKNLQLVVPTVIQQTYSPGQQQELIGVGDFIGVAKNRQL